MITIDIWSAIHTLNEICGILSFIVSVVALVKVVEIHKTVISGNSAKFDIAGQHVTGNKNRNITQVGGDLLERKKPKS